MKKSVKTIIGIVIAILVILSFVFNLWYITFNKVLNCLIEEPYEVSMVQLLAHPRRYDGRRIMVEGVGCLEFEGTALYLTMGDYENIVGKNSVWLNFYHGDEDSFNVVNGESGEYVLVEGIFNRSNKGHYDMHSGAIERITRYDRSRSRNE